jgi:hypothetical protein
MDTPLFALTTVDKGGIEERPWRSMKQAAKVDMPRSALKLWIGKFRSLMIFVIFRMHNDCGNFKRAGQIFFTLAN